MTVVPIGEWLPDLPALNNPGCPTLLNALPISQAAYGPFPSFGDQFGPPLPDRCIGAYALDDSLDQSRRVLAATANRKLMQIQLVPHTRASAWTSNTPTAGIVVATGQTQDQRWRFARYLNTVVAANAANHTLQIGADPTSLAGLWTDLNSYNSGANTGAPSARYVCVTLSGFVVLANVGWPPANTAGATVQYPRRVWWSAIGAPTLWPTPGSAAAVAVQSGFVEMPSDMGDITGLTPNINGIDFLVHLERGIVRMIYIGGLAVFQAQAALGSHGTLAPDSLVKVDNTAYYLSEDGFYAFDGSNNTPLGAGKVDRWFFANCNTDPKQVIGFYDRVNRGIRWMCGQGAISDTHMFYSIPFTRWGVGRLAQTFGFTGINTNDENVPIVFDNRNVPWIMNGQPLQMSFSSAERRLFPARRSFVTGIKPLIDGGKPTVGMAWRQNQTDAQITNAPTAQDAAGVCPQRLDAYFTQATMATDGQTNWTQVLGFDVPDEYVVQSGFR